jgi:hypothetical protein
MSHIHKIAFLACRILSVYILANWLGALAGSAVSLLYFPPNGQIILSSVVSMALPVAIGVLIWIFSGRLAALMVKPAAGQAGEEEPAGPVDWDTVQVVAFSITGVFFIVNAVPSLVSAFAVYTLLPQPNIGQAGLQNASRMAEAVIRILLGVWLVLGSKGLVKLLKKIRTAGVNPNE